ncbi:16803_t:CDS:2 [Dentiscutata erythropus]|uniref:16803_t:CDS:1 n=1 Tax=Dentiscutata erythropus TaxID=1348616 RepID=A0A9N9CSQ5_9GLOM|nr:16803_t:CDS:2 [Dentiscutata erythropus]
MGEYSINDISQELAKHLDFSETSTEAVHERGPEQCRKCNEQNGRNKTVLRTSSKELYEAAHHLDALYNKIDALECFVNIVKQTVNDVTNRVEEAEAFVTNPINLVLDTLKINTAKSIEPSDLKLPPMRSLNIYRTSDYFPPEAETSEQL